MKFNLPRIAHLALVLIASFSSLEARSRYVEIKSIEDLRKAAVNSDQKVRMVPGTYVIEGTEPGNQTVLEFSGSNNTFDLTGVTIELPTDILRDMDKTHAHSLRVYTILGDKLTFKGGHFEDTGDHPPSGSVADFFVEGDDVTFEDCSFVVRGSAPYGVGDMLGKGRGSAVRLQKHSAMAVTGDRLLVDNCKFRIHTFGHGIHIHGSQDTHLRNVYMKGDQRNTDDIYESKDPLMAKFDFKIQYPDWLKGQPIPRGQWIGLTEDGIRAYLDGTHKSGEQRRTGHVTVEECEVDSMRGGITLVLAGRATVTDSVAINCSHGFSVPANSVIRDCKGNAANGPLLALPYSHKGNSEIELELLNPYEGIVGDHPLAEISGHGHEITITTRGNARPEKLRPIIIGTTGTRYTDENTGSSEVQEKNSANGIKLENKTRHPVILTPYSSSCEVRSRGEILEDKGEDNKAR